MSNPSSSKVQILNHTRNEYIDGTYEDALKRGCDIVQLKFDGWWCRMVARENTLTYYSETGRPFLTEFASLPDCELIGEYMRGTQWAKQDGREGTFYIYDVISMSGQPVSNVYMLRYALLRRFSPFLRPKWDIVLNYRIQEFHAVWAEFVDKRGYEGVVFRTSTDSLDARLIRQKKEITLTGIVVAIEEGIGKHTGRLGTCSVRIENGPITKVGNGFSDAEREEYWSHPERCVGRTMEFRTNKVFTSGNVRHGRFLRWRDDKLNTPSSPVAVPPPV